MLSFFYNGQIGRNKSIATGLRKIHPEMDIFFFIGTLIVINYSTDATSFPVTVVIDKISVAIFFEARIKRQIKLVASIFVRPMKMLCIFFKQIIGSEIGSTAKPSVQQFIFFIIEFKHPVI